MIKIKKPIAKLKKSEQILSKDFKLKKTKKTTKKRTKKQDKKSLNFVEKFINWIKK
jgi:hypothetical protein